MSTTYTLFCAPSSQSDVQMGEEYESILQAQENLSSMMSEWDSQCGNEGDKLASECRWYVWDNDARKVVAELSP